MSSQSLLSVVSAIFRKPRPLKMAARATIHTGVSFINPVTELSDHDRAIPSTYIFLTEDQILPPTFRIIRLKCSRANLEQTRCKLCKCGLDIVPMLVRRRSLRKLLAVF